MPLQVSNAFAYDASFVKFVGETTKFNSNNSAYLSKLEMSSAFCLIKGRLSPGYLNKLHLTHKEDQPCSQVRIT